MFSIFGRCKLDPHALISSRLYDERSFYYAFTKDLSKANRFALIESPFLTVKRARDFVSIIKRLDGSGVKVRINTREPRHHTPLLRQEAWTAIGLLQKAGATVYLCNDLRHRKFAVIDNIILWEGSLNILSQGNSREVMRRTSSPQLCKQMIDFTKANRKF